MPDITPPVVVELGRQKKKKIKQLRAGRGPLADEVRQTVDEAIARLGSAAEGKTFVPVVLVYRRKERRTALSFLG